MNSTARFRRSMNTSSCGASRTSITVAASRGVTTATPRNRSPPKGHKRRALRHQSTWRVASPREPSTGAELRWRRGPTARVARRRPGARRALGPPARAARRVRPRRDRGARERMSRASRRKARLGRRRDRRRAASRRAAPGSPLASRHQRHRRHRAHEPRSGAGRRRRARRRRPMVARLLQPRVPHGRRRAGLAPRARRRAARPRVRRRSRPRREQQRGGGAALAGGAGPGPRGRRLARRAGRDRRRLPGARDHGRVRLPAGRGGHHQPHPPLRLRGRRRADTALSSRCTRRTTAWSASSSRRRSPSSRRSGRR